MAIWYFAGMSARSRWPGGVLAIAVVIACPATAGTPQKNGLRPETILPQTRARLPLDSERLYLGMQETAFLTYVRAQGWELVEQNESLRRGNALAVLYAPGGEVLTTVGGEHVLAQGVFVRLFFARNRLVGLQLMPNFSEGGITLRQLQLLARAWFPDDRLQLRYQVLPEDSAQQIIEALIGHVPEPFSGLTGRTPIPVQSLVLVP